MVGPEEPGTFVVELHAEALLVNGAVMTAAQEHQIVQVGGAPLGPVSYVMGIAMAGVTTRESTSAVSGRQRPPERGWYDPCLATNIER